MSAEFAHKWMGFQILHGSQSYGFSKINRTLGLFTFKLGPHAVRITI